MDENGYKDSMVTYGIHHMRSRSFPVRVVERKLPYWSPVLCMCVDCARHIRASVELCSSGVKQFQLRVSPTKARKGDLL